MAGQRQVSIVKSKLILEYLDGKQWKVVEPFKAYSHVLSQWISVPEGFITDFNSVPRFFWRLIPPTECGEAGLLHDYLYRFAENKGKSVTREQADLVHREFLIWKGAPAWKVFTMYRTLQAFGWNKWNEYRAGEKSGE